jgi:hypothetical protein
VIFAFIAFLFLEAWVVDLLRERRRRREEGSFFL